jgi:hypothetical protein
MASILERCGWEIIQVEPHVPGCSLGSGKPRLGRYTVVDGIALTGQKQLGSHCWQTFDVDVRPYLVCNRTCHLLGSSSCTPDSRQSSNVHKTYISRLRISYRRPSLQTYYTTAVHTALHAGEFAGLDSKVTTMYLFIPIVEQLRCILSMIVAEVADRVQLGRLLGLR